MNRPIRQHPEALPPEILRVVEGIALALAQEHHAADNAEKGLCGAERAGFDPDGFGRQEC